jgi:hypothetical protein
VACAAITKNNDGGATEVEIHDQAGYLSIYRKTPGALADGSENLPLSVRILTRL